MGLRTRLPERSQGDDEEIGPLRVLLVDDDAGLIKSLTKALEARGMTVLSAGTAADALALIADPAVGIDIVVMDLVLPDSWGSQVAMEQTLYRPDVPVVYISGYARGDAVLAASTIGDVGPFLEKPFTPDELVKLIRRVAHERTTDEG